MVIAVSWVEHEFQVEIAASSDSARQPLFRQPAQVMQFRVDALLLQAGFDIGFGQEVGRTAKPFEL